MIESLPRFPPLKPQRLVAGLHYLTKAELSALYFATYKLRNTKGWGHPLPIGCYWRSALVLFFNYGLDTGTIWKSSPAHEPILWRHIFWSEKCPDGQAKSRSRWGWLYYRRVKTGKKFYRPLNQTSHLHLRRLELPDPAPAAPVFFGGGPRPSTRFQELCRIARITPKIDIETGREKSWQLKDLRKTCATYYDAHVPESSIEILGHSIGGITYKHYARRDLLAFKAIASMPQPLAFTSLQKNLEGACPCCQRQFVCGRIDVTQQLANWYLRNSKQKQQIVGTSCVVIAA